MSEHNFTLAALRTISLEANAIAQLNTRIDQGFVNACKLILDCKGRVIVTGMGKSGHIGNKIASTLASTGTPAFFVHPGEASHGDLGMITNADVVIAISNSGNTSEIITLVPLIKRLGIPLISMSGAPHSTPDFAGEIVCERMRLDAVAVPLVRPVHSPYLYRILWMSRVGKVLRVASN